MRASGGSGGDDSNEVMEEEEEEEEMVDIGGCRQYQPHATPHTIDFLMHDIQATQARGYTLPAKPRANVCSKSDVRGASTTNWQISPAD